jgi:hypothetical protein
MPVCIVLESSASAQDLLVHCTITRKEDYNSSSASEYKTNVIGQVDQTGGAAETCFSWTPAGERTTSSNTSGPYWG